MAPRIVIAFDTSGSMGQDLTGNMTFGDGVLTGCSTRTSPNGRQYLCGTNCTAGLDTDCDGLANDSRMFIAKEAVRNMVLAFGDVDWALARFGQSQGRNLRCDTVDSTECGFTVTSFGNPQCNSGANIPSGSCDIGGFIDPIPNTCEPGRSSNDPLQRWASGSPSVCVNYSGGCAPGDILVGFSDMGAFTGMNNTYGIVSWLNGTETNFVDRTTPGNFCNSATNGDCELRPTGSTPLAGLLNEAGSYITPIRAADPSASCRPYSVILLTDGQQQPGCTPNDPMAAAATLRSNGIETYVVGFAAGGGAETQLNAIATAGGTDAGDPGGDTAYFASNQAELAAGLADIVRRSLRVEVCNGLDDDCDVLVDEGVTNACGTCGAAPVETCNATDDDCDGTVDEGVANACGDCGATPAETCNRLDDDCDGIIDEDGAGGDICAGCTPSAESCDGNDDDCDGTVDEGVTRACGTEVGVCQAGTETCVVGGTGTFGSCVGAVGATPGGEVCNNLDDDCDGTVDGFSQPCGSSVGACSPGNQVCIAGSFGSCVGGIAPSPEICDGIDNNCAGGVDEGNPGGGGTCGTGIGICEPGVRTCMGGSVMCVGGTGPDPVESCNGLDDDCDGATDEGIPTAGACGSSVGECRAGALTCVGGGFTCVGARGPSPDICDGLDNDCASGIDEGNPGGGVTCGSSIGICTPGTSACVAGRLECTGGTPPSAAETCDGRDEDCDGAVDEGVPTMGACGSDVGECAAGVNTCMGGTYTCIGARGMSPELCDGLDNDCDGVVDDGDPEGGGACGSMVGSCIPGTLRCTGGALVCDGEIGPLAETCDGTDEDCDTLIDEGFFDGTPCGTDLGVCVPGLRQCTTGGVSCGCPLGYALRVRAGDGAELCVPEGTPAGPLVEECNSFDDDCDGAIDEGLGVGGACGSDEGLCMPGTQQCVDGRVVCVGEVGPGREGCDCDDNDCDGTVDEAPDTGDLCPSGSECVDCQCALPCVSSEFGFTCPTGKTASVDGAGACFCVADACDDAICGTETVERDGATLCGPDSVSSCVCKNNECTFPCDGVVCGDGTVCDPRDPSGRCVIDDCTGLGCDDGELCDVASGECLADPCADVSCEADEACRGGTCEGSCATVDCGAGEVCRAGSCVDDLCDDASCATGEVCDPASGDCIENLCIDRRCPGGQECDLSTGNCVADGCATLHCPSGEVCEGGECAREVVPTVDAGGVDAGVDAGFDAGSDGRDRVLAAGGCFCTVGPGRDRDAPAAPPLFLALGLLGAVLLRRGRRRRGRAAGRSEAPGRLPLVATIAMVLGGGALASGCEVDPFCLDCVEAPPEDAGVDAGPRDSGPRDAGPRDSGRDAGTDADTGADACLADELCNALDDDCDGTVDEGIDTDTDLEHCGGCGDACAPVGAFGECVGGVCGISSCDVGRHDIDGDPTTGCEYRCLATGTDDTVCDLRDNDCDGSVDEDVDTTTDINHCGTCGRTCRFAHADASCGPTGTPAMGTCQLGACEEGWTDADGAAANGCEYSCTPTSDPMEVCDAIDNDCDPTTLDGVDDPLLTTSCGTSSEGECSLGTYARCTGGRLICEGSVEPTAELCNGLDDNCDLAIDDGNPGGGRLCASAVGVCVSGRENCVSAALTCQCPAGFTLLNAPGRGDFCAPAGSTLTELCNGLDDDCDGTIDEGDPEGGGNCGTDTGECAFGTERCTGGVIVCTGGTGPTAELCDGLDNDCNPATADGSADTRVGEGCGTDLGVCSPGARECTSGALSCRCPAGFTLTMGGATQYCVPAGSSLAETCNGLDDDCDGTVDDGNPGGGGTCGTDVGACDFGSRSCTGGALQCTIPPGGGPSLETCNSVDDDCDGSVDEDFDTMNNVNHCGGCGIVCSFPNAVAGCSGGVCEIIACDSGFYDVSAAAPGCEYACEFRGSEICNGFDDDCNGQTDGPSELTPPSNFCNPNGLCAGTTPTCEPTGWVCDYGASYEGSETRCDGADNDCDGLIDEPFPTVGDPCGNGSGICRRTGTIQCTGDGSGTSCSAASAGTPAAFESCNNLDDDCDGVIDENIPVNAIPTVQMSGPSGTFRIMQYEASRPDARATSLPGLPAEGTVTTHACSNANVVPWTNLTWAEASAACCALNSGGACGGTGWRLCDAPDWQAACEGPAAPVCDWSYESSCRSSSPLTCNGTEYDSDSGTSGDQNALRTTASSDFPMCFTDWNAAGVVYDLSGNVKEWTNTATTTDVHEIRGGAYNNIEPGRTCQFAFTAGDENFAFPNTGFRCCHY